MVAFDAHFVMLALRPAIPASVDHAKERVINLVVELEKAQERIIIPTPALTEFLIHADAAGPTYLDTIQKSSRFKIGSFGVRAAVEAAAVIASAVRKGNKRDGSKDTWAKVNFDRQIAAIAKVEGAHTIYTDDANLKKFAGALGLKVVTLEEVPIPPSKTPLLDHLEELNAKEQAKATRTSQDSTGLHTDGVSSTGDEARAEKEEKA